MKSRALGMCWFAGMLVFAGGQAPLVAADSPPLFRVLVFSKTTGYRHASITNGIAAIRELGAGHNFAVDATEDASVFTRTNLARYQAVVFLSVTGDVLDLYMGMAPKEWDRFLSKLSEYSGVPLEEITYYTEQKTDEPKM